MVLRSTILRNTGLRSIAVAGLGFLVGSSMPAQLAAYPGGTPDFQTDVMPFCAACHSSTNETDLEGAPGDRAVKEVAAQKHLAGIMAGTKTYAELAAPDRAKLVDLIKAVDAASTIELEFPPSVAPGETFQVTARIAGGSGPAVGVGLVDRAHRWWAKPASTLGWAVVGSPTIIGPDGGPQSEWLNRRPERKGRNVTFVNVTDWKSNAEAQQWASAKVIFTLRAPEKAGEYPLVGFYLYGTEKATTLGTKPNPMYGDQPLGGYTGKSGRVKFTESHVITVK